jgi:hypothetical protein
VWLSSRSPSPVTLPSSAPACSVRLRERPRSKSSSCLILSGGLGGRACGMAGSARAAGIVDIMLPGEAAFPEVTSKRLPRSGNGQVDSRWTAASGTATLSWGFSSLKQVGGSRRQNMVTQKVYCRITTQLTDFTEVEAVLRSSRARQRRRCELSCHHFARANATGVRLA